MCSHHLPFPGAWMVYSGLTLSDLQAQQLKAKEQQLQMQQLQLIQQRHVQMQRRDANHQSFNGPINAIGSDGILGPSTATVLAAKLYQEQMKHTNGLDSKASPQLLDAGRMAMLNSATNHPG